MAVQALGFCSSPIERTAMRIEASQPLPVWLQGVLLRTGPALFELGQDQLAHWFDGLAKLQQLTIGADGIVYTSRLLQSRALHRYRRSGRLASQEFASRPHRTGVRQLLERLVGPQLTDNGNVNVLPLPDGSWLALTETTRPIQISPTLDGARPFRYSDRIQGQVTTAHPVCDSSSGEVINLVIQLGLRSCYHFTSWHPGSGRRRLIASLPVRDPSYVHSFAVTPHFLVLLESPLRVNPLRLRFSGLPYIDNYRWRDTEGSQVWILERDTGRVVARHAWRPCFHFHVVNAWEEEGCVLVDLPLYDDAAVIDGLRLAPLRAGRSLPSSRLCRLSIPLAGGRVQEERLMDQTVELPGLHPAWQGRRHPVAFVAASSDGVFLDSLVRWQEGVGASHRWRAPGCYPGEPLFVPGPGAGGDSGADQGVVLSMVLDTARSLSYLLVLDGCDLRELSRIDLPDVVPFSFHGQFALDARASPC